MCLPLSYNFTKPGGCDFRREKIYLQMIEKYGITEVEATNILNGYGTSDYIGKYERIRNGIPLTANSDRSNPVEEITVLEKHCEGSEQRD